MSVWLPLGLTVLVLGGLVVGRRVYAWRDRVRAWREIRESIERLTTSIGLALSPAIQEYARVLREDVIPAFRRFGEALARAGLSVQFDAQDASEEPSAAEPGPIG